MCEQTSYRNFDLTCGLSQTVVHHKPHIRINSGLVTTSVSTSRMFVFARTSALFGSLLVQLACLSIVSANSEQTDAHRIETVTMIMPLPAFYTAYPSIHAAFGVRVDARNWQDAKQACKDEGSFFAVVDTLEKVRFAGENQPQDSDVWVGIIRQGTDWVSANENLPLSNLPWVTGQPNDDKDCVALDSSGTGLSSKNCSEVKPYICELRTRLPEKPKIELRSD